MIDDPLESPKCFPAMAYPPPLIQIFDLLVLEDTPTRTGGIIAPV
jgi:hypothetical protein